MQTDYVDRDIRHENRVYVNKDAVYNADASVALCASAGCSGCDMQMPRCMLRPKSRPCMQAEFKNKGSLQQGKKNTMASLECGQG